MSNSNSLLGFNQDKEVRDTLYILFPINAAFPDGVEIPLNNDSKIIVDGVDTLVSVMFPWPFKAIVKGTDIEDRTTISLVYCAAPEKVEKLTDFIDLGINYNDAILNYMAYLAHGAVDGSMETTNNAYYMRFLASCKEITNKTMMIDNIDSNMKLVQNGWV